MSYLITSAMLKVVLKAMTIKITHNGKSPYLHISCNGTYLYMLWTYYSLDMSPTNDKYYWMDIRMTLP